MSCIEQYSKIYGMAIVTSLMLCACAASSNSGPTDGSGGSGGDPQSTGSGNSIVMKNLNINLTKMDGDSRLTFALENTSSKTLKQCSNGSIVTSTGNTAVVEFKGGSCYGIVGPNASVTEGYCADYALDDMCQTGLPPGATTGILAVYGATYGIALDPWEEPGTTYTLTLNFLMEDAEAVSAQAVTTMK